MIVVASATSFCLGIFLIFRFLLALRPASLSQRLLPRVETMSFRGSLANRILEISTRTLEPRRKMQKVFFELPDFLELLSVALSSGESVYSALNRVVPRISGVLAIELKAALKALDFGSDLATELAALAQRLPQPQLVEVCNKLILALRRGAPLAVLLMEQAEAVRQAVGNQITKQAGKNETRMLIPLVFLILPITVLFAIYPSLQMLSINYL